MDLDDLLKQRRERLRSMALVRRRSDRCLSLADLEEAAKDEGMIAPSSEAHLRVCERCRTLRDRFVAVQASGCLDAEFDAFEEQRTRDVVPGRERRLLRIAAATGFFLSAACILLAVAIWPRPIEPDATRWLELLDDIEETAEEADGYYIHLIERDRAAWDTERLSQISEQRRLAIEALLNTLGDLAEQAREARRETEPTSPKDGP